jgi:hypothetical protein
MDSPVIIGDWMGSIYTIGGTRYDWRLFLDHDGRYERVIRLEPDFEGKDIGRWEFSEIDEVLRFFPDAPGVDNCKSNSWWVLSVKMCEKSNVLLVLREAVLASRNLPIVLYRVHCNGRAYGTNLVADESATVAGKEHRDGFEGSEA